MTEYHEHSRILQANFRNMTLRDKGRGDRRGTESVAEEKFSIVFQVFYHLPTGKLWPYDHFRPSDHFWPIFQADIIVRSPACEFTVTAQTLSLPVVVISHGKQEANAAATIFWDNAFSEEVGHFTNDVIFITHLEPSTVSRTRTRQLGSFHGSDRL